MSLQAQGTWWHRNWKWFVPTGCLGLLAVLLGFVALVVLGAFGAMKTSDAYRGAFSRAEANAAVQQDLGSPIEEGLYLTGSINVSGSSGHADISFPISGPAGTATVYAVADKSGGTWNYTALEAEIELTQERINLLE
ncbi:MAG: cytochrome c oxidase assembly factor Coa1 family protein [Myxococcaceae bacterium]